MGKIKITRYKGRKSKVKHCPVCGKTMKKWYEIFWIYQAGLWLYC